jgi:hypothetical protein
MLHGFRPDGVAYLLNLIGKILISRKIKILDFQPSDYCVQGTNAFRGVLCSDLVNEAKKLDGRIKQLRRNSRETLLNLLKDLLFIKEYGKIAQEYKDDKEEMPSTSKLEEMRNIARINLAIRYIIDDEINGFIPAKKKIDEVRESSNKNTIFLWLKHAYKS